MTYSIVARDADTGELGAAIQSKAFCCGVGTLWVEAGVGDGTFGRLDPDRGTFTEFALADTTATPIGITAGSDGNLWFAQKKANKIGRMSTSGAFAEFDLPTPNAGPDAEAPRRKYAAAARRAGFDVPLGVCALRCSRGPRRNRTRALSVRRRHILTALPNSSRPNRNL